MTSKYKNMASNFSPPLDSSGRGQIHVLEAIIAASLVLGAIIFALQATAITPLTVSSSDQHIETQNQKMATGVLTTSKATQTYSPTRISPPYTYNSQIKVANPEPSSTTQHVTAVNITGNAVGNSLNTLSINYVGADVNLSKTVSGSGLKQLNGVAIDKDGSGTPDVSALDDVINSTIDATDSNTTLEFEAIGNYNLEADDVLIISYSSVVNPSTLGDYTVEIDINGDIIASRTLPIQSNSSQSQSDKISSIEEAILYWDVNNQTFHRASPQGYIGTYPNIAFGGILESIFRTRQTATNVNFVYQEKDGSRSSIPFINQGKPSDNAVTATTSVILMDNQSLTAPGTNQNIGNTTNYFIPDASPNTNVYNVVQVRLVVWRI